ncbi:thiamine diphosphokinase [Mucilaginibacter glaciei]|uniref:Thiamine diphosphokinase n=1 Tax=Mucilaginibacter glaciei TaxID=2772109 RepID=A0A926NV22_9SPHI|nr:thiamine diphosphokinase [Mucilaginibacter glaciei]MBD1395225.1 thiamine diphosphokinase [Mucilaginibacter glaciei]
MNKDKSIIDSMSSHHIVREKQEPALLVLGLDHFDDELLGQLLEWSPTVITTPLTAEQINSQGIKVDLIIADEPDASMQSDVRLISAGDNNVEAAMQFLLTSDYQAVNIVTDQLPLAELAPFATQINLVIFSGRQKIYPVTSGFSKWKPVGESVHILSATKDLQITGLESAGNGYYVTTADGFFTLTFNEEFLFIAEDI